MISLVCDNNRGKQEDVKALVEIRGTFTRQCVGLWTVLHAGQKWYKLYLSNTDNLEENHAT